MNSGYRDWLVPTKLLQILHLCIETVTTINKRLEGFLSSVIDSPKGLS